MPSNHRQWDCETDPCDFIIEQHQVCMLGLDKNHEDIDSLPHRKCTHEITNCPVVCCADSAGATQLNPKSLSAAALCSVTVRTSFGTPCPAMRCHATINHPRRVPTGRVRACAAVGGVLSSTTNLSEQLWRRGLKGVISPLPLLSTIPASAILHATDAAPHNECASITLFA